MGPQHGDGDRGDIKACRSFTTVTHVFHLRAKYSDSVVTPPPGDSSCVSSGLLCLIFGLTLTLKVLVLPLSALWCCCTVAWSSLELAAHS